MLRAFIVAHFYERLTACSDRQLADMGLERKDIPRTIYYELTGPLRRCASIVRDIGDTASSSSPKARVPKHSSLMMIGAQRSPKTSAALASGQNWEYVVMGAIILSPTASDKYNFSYVNGRMPLQDFRVFRIAFRRNRSVAGTRCASVHTRSKLPGLMGIIQ